MNLTVVTPPPFEPVTLEQVYRQLRLDPDGSPPEHPDDALVRGYITTARDWVEKATRRSLVQQTLRLSIGAWPIYAGGCWLSGWRSSPDRILLLRPPFVRLTSVGYWDSDNILQMVDPADYYVTDDLVPELRFTAAYTPPVAYLRPDAVRVDYVTGYAPEGSPPDETQEAYAAAVPQALKDAILIGVQLFYDNPPPAEREALERMREAIVQTYRIPLTV